MTICIRCSFLIGIIPLFNYLQYGQLLLTSFINKFNTETVKFIQQGGRSIEDSCVAYYFQKYINCLTLCYYHFTCPFQSESTLYSCLNVKELLAQNNGIRTHNHLVGKRTTLNHLSKLIGQCCECSPVWCICQMIDMIITYIQMHTAICVLPFSSFFFSGTKKVTYFLFSPRRSNCPSNFSADLLIIN